MRALGTIVLCAAVGMSFAAEAASAEKVSRATCYVTGKTLIANEQVRVSVVVKKGKKPPLTTARYYACNQRRKQRFLIYKGGEFESSQRKELVSPSLHGDLVGFMRAGHSALSCGGRVIVFDTKRGRVLRKSEPTACAYGLVVTARGFAAWGYGVENEGEYIAALDSTGTRVLAHAGPDDEPLDVFSLYATDGFGSEPDVAYWVQNDRQMSAELK